MIALPVSIPRGHEQESRIHQVGRIGGFPFEPSLRLVELLLSTTKPFFSLVPHTILSCPIIRIPSS